MRSYDLHQFKEEKNTPLLVPMLVPYLVELGCKGETELLAYSVSEDAMQRSADREGEQEVGTRCAGDNTVDPHPTATVGTALCQQITSPACCSYSFRPDLLALPILVTVFTLLMVSSQQGPGLLQGTAPLTAQMQIEHQRSGQETSLS